MKKFDVYDYDKLVDVIYGATFLVQVAVDRSPMAWTF